MPKLPALLRGAIAALSVTVMLTSCYSSQQLVQPSLSQKVSQNPQFLDGIAMGGRPKNLSLTTHDICIEDLQPRTSGETHFCRDMPAYSMYCQRPFQTYLCTVLSMSGMAHVTGLAVPISMV